MPPQAANQRQVPYIRPCSYPMPQTINPSQLENRLTFPPLQPPPNLQNAFQATPSEVRSKQPPPPSTQADLSIRQLKEILATVEKVTDISDLPFQSQPQEMVRRFGLYHTANSVCRDYQRRLHEYGPGMGMFTEEDSLVARTVVKKIEENLANCEDYLWMLWGSWDPAWQEWVRAKDRWRFLWRAYESSDGQ